MVDEDDDVTFHIPSPKFSSLGVGQNFKVPFPLLEFWTPTTKQKDEDGDRDTPTGSGGSAEVDDEPVELTLHAGAVGRVVPQYQKFIISDEHAAERELLVSRKLLRRLLYGLTFL